jgi:predicted CXXCH cytochrome family protein
MTKTASNYILAILVPALCFLLNLQALAAEVNPCLTCHGDLKAQKTIHQPLAMGCEACHKAIEGKNHPGKGSMVLIKGMPDLCYGCHEEAKFKGSSIHKPVSGGMCKVCHNPHGSDYSKLLTSAPSDLCYNCHEKEKFNKKYTHKVINVIGCAACHNAHASNNPSLLSNPINEVCAVCHKAQSSGLHIVSLPGRTIHPIKDVKDISTLKMIKVPDPKNPKVQVEVPDPNVPGKELSCASCHNPHSSDYSKLFPQQRICLKCHKY